MCEAVPRLDRGVMLAAPRKSTCIRTHSGDEKDVLILAKRKRQMTPSP